MSAAEVQEIRRASALTFLSRTWLRPGSPAAYATSAAIMLAVSLARAAISLVEPNVPPFLFVFPAVLAIGWCCGIGPGVLAIVLGAGGADFLWTTARSDALRLPPVDPLIDAVFVMVSGTTLCGIFLLRRALAAAETTRTMLDAALGKGDVGTLELDLESRTVIGTGSARELHRVAAGPPACPLDQWLAAIVRPDLDRVRETLETAAASGRSFAIEYGVSGPGGEIRQILLRGGVALVAGRRRLCAALIDVTERVRAEAALAYNEERLRLALESGGIGTWEVDLDTGRRHWDERIARMHGLPGAMEISSEQIVERFHPDDVERGVQHFRRSVELGRMEEIEFRAVTVSGEIRWVVSSGLVLAAPDGRGRMIGATRDVTEQKHREVALREALAAREMLVREADHRIKNSLQLVVSLLILQRRRLSDPEAAAALASAAARVEAVAQSHRALQQSQDLRTIDLGRALKELCERLSGLSPGVTVDNRFAGTLALDAERAIPLALVISELLTNAIRHAYPNCAGTVTVDVEVSAGAVAITVADSGVGYVPGERPGGLGSQVVNSLSRQIGADVAVRSRPGEGTATTVSLPIVPRT